MDFDREIILKAFDKGFNLWSRNIPFEIDQKRKVVILKIHQQEEREVPFTDLMKNEIITELCQ